jgi:hypothetical protein
VSSSNAPEPQHPQDEEAEEQSEAEAAVQEENAGTSLDQPSQ